MTSPHDGCVQGEGADSQPAGEWISGGTFARYAESDLERWRLLIGQRVVPCDQRWGTGEVISVTWGSASQHVPSFIQVKTRYARAMSVTVNADAWQQHHRAVSVPAFVAATVRHCFESGLDEDAAADCLAQHVRDLRERVDRQALDRAARMRMQILDARAGDPTAEDGAADPSPGG